MNYTILLYDESSCICSEAIHHKYMYKQLQKYSSKSKEINKPTNTRYGLYDTEAPVDKTLYSNENIERMIAHNMGIESIKQVWNDPNCLMVH